jgi:hypothetical protein
MVYGSKLSQLEAFIKVKIAIYPLNKTNVFISCLYYMVL